MLRKEYAEQLLREEHLWKVGKSDTFTVEMSGKEWEFTLRKEEDAECAPFKYSLEGAVAGTNESWSRSYPSMAAALLHIVNRLNENTSVKNQYESIEEWLKKQNIMVYYWEKGVYGGKDKIVARCYKTSYGYKFEVGSAFEHRDPVTGLQRFFATRSSRCENKRDLKYEEERLRRLHQNTDIYTTEEPYR